MKEYLTDNWKNPRAFVSNSATLMGEVRDIQREQASQKTSRELRRVSEDSSQTPEPSLVTGTYKKELW